MDRIDRSVDLTSSETASLLAVHPSTVKRWCNEGDLRSDVTPGGHRRIPIGAAVDFARSRGIPTRLDPFHPYESHVWTALRAVEETDSFEELSTLALQWARRGRFERLEQLFLALGRSPDVTVSSLCDDAVRGVMVRVGEEWAAGRMRVGDEHMVSQAIAGALHTLRREWLDRRKGIEYQSRPVAVVGALEGNHHNLGALSVRVLLERLGWTVFYPGPDLPVADFAFIQRSREASLVCVSLPPVGTMGDLRRSLDVLAETYNRARPYALVFGGPSQLTLDVDSGDLPFESVSFFPACASLQSAVEDGLGTVGGSA